MTDIEQRLGEVLAARAAEAPEAGGLAVAARRRAGARRHRRIALGGVAAALAVAIPAVVLGMNAGDDRSNLAPDPTLATSTAAADWQEISHDGVTLDVPATWRAACDGSIPRYAPGGDCESEAEEVRFLVADTFEPATEPGEIVEATEDGRRVWGGFVPANERWAILVRSADRDVTRRILDSVHVEEGSGGPEGDRRQAEFDGVTADVPASWRRLECEGDLVEFAPYDACAGIGEGLRFADPAVHDPPLDEGEIVRHTDAVEPMWGGWVRAGGWIVLVNHPDRAVTESVLASVR